MKQKKKVRSAAYQPGIVTLLIAIIAGISLILLAYFGVILSA